MGEEGTYFRNEGVCSACGKCCLIYADPEHRGIYPVGQVWFEEYVENFHQHPEAYGVEPFHDPLESHARVGDPRYDSLRADLDARGIDYHACQYLGKGGCIIPWEKRPGQCKEYSCEKIKNHPNTEVIDESKEVHDE